MSGPKEEGVLPGGVRSVEQGMEDELGSGDLV